MFSFTRTVLFLKFHSQRDPLLLHVHQDGLVHISQLSDKFIKHPSQAVSLGDVVKVKVLSVDVQKKRISLTMKFKE